jgi:RNA polymerase sigma factor (sigma-70 family)
MAIPTPTADMSEQPGIDDAFRDMRARLHAFIARRVESPQTAEDLTQEVMLRLLRSSSNDLADPTAWLYRVARNVIIDHYRTRHRTQPLDVDTATAADACSTPSQTIRTPPAVNLPAACAPWSNNCPSHTDPPSPLSTSTAPPTRPSRLAPGSASPA